MREIINAAPFAGGDETRVGFDRVFDTHEFSRGNQGLRIFTIGLRDDGIVGQ